MVTTAAASSDVRGLTGIRGVAALLVATYHFALPQLTVGSLGFRLLGRGYLYVDLFFILSGYVIALNYGSNFAYGVDFKSFRAFLWKRIARVYPLYLAVLSTMVIGYWLVHRDFDLHPGWWISVQMSRPWLDLPLNAALIQTWGFGDGIVGQAWSVSAEVAAYLVFPWLARGIFGNRRGGLVFLVVLGVAATLVAAQHFGSTDGQYHAGAFDIWDGPPAVMRGLGGFTLGLCLYRLSGSRIDYLVSSDFFGLCAIGLWLVMLDRSTPDLLLYIPFGALVLCLSNNRGKLGAVFGSAPLYGMGLLSYSFYLIHVYFIPPMHALTSFLSPIASETLAKVVAMATTIAALLVCSSVAYVAVERPARNLLRRSRRSAGSGSRAVRESRDPNHASNADLRRRLVHTARFASSVSESDGSAFTVTIRPARGRVRGCRIAR
ncbi:MAG: acyltransferase [Pseudomonadota bacterium]|nr:acyltransferase [Pseudomonadota bacterium]